MVLPTPVLLLGPSRNRSSRPWAVGGPDAGMRRWWSVALTTRRVILQRATDAAGGSVDPAYTLRGFLLGFTIAASVGPISLLVIRRTLA